MDNTAAYTFADRLNNRLVRALPGRRFDAATTMPIVSFTFDDVPDTALSNGAAILERHGVRGTFYIAGGLAGTVEPGRQMITEAGTRALAKAGHEIGCHTFGHPKVSRLGRRRLAADLDRNDAYLDGIAGSARRNFAYPYNAASFVDRPEFRRRFRTCRGGIESINRGATDMQFLRAVEIRQPEDYALGLTHWIDAVAAEPGWLIFFVHDVTDSPTPYGCRPATLELLVKHAVSEACAVLTVEAALDRLGAPR
jgi:peptidoglycan/xylan/chitin deacetylase (PgdA/CDA1 family)